MPEFNGNINQSPQPISITLDDAGFTKLLKLLKDLKATACEMNNVHLMLQYVGNFVADKSELNYLIISIAEKQNANRGILECDYYDKLRTTLHALSDLSGGDLSGEDLNTTFLSVFINIVKAHELALDTAIANKPELGNSPVLILAVQNCSDKLRQILYKGNENVTMTGKIKGNYGETIRARITINDLKCDILKFYECLTTQWEILSTGTTVDALMMMSVSGPECEVSIGGGPPTNTGGNPNTGGSYIDPNLNPYDNNL